LSDTLQSCRRPRPEALSRPRETLLNPQPSRDIGVNHLLIGSLVSRFDRFNSSRNPTTEVSDLETPSNSLRGYLSPIPVRLVLALNPHQYPESPAYKPSANTIAIPAAADRVVKLTPMLAPAAGLVGVEVDDAELVLVPPTTACPLRMTVMLNCVLFAHSWVGASARKVISAHCQPR